VNLDFADTSEIFYQNSYGDLLIQEQTHRFYNTLQIINSHLSLIATPGAPEELSLQLAGIRNRIMALSQLHRRLGQARDPEQTLEGHCRQICLDLIHASLRGDLRLSLCMERVAVRPDAETRLVYLLVELVTNAIKHSRQDGAGTIWIDLRRRSSDELELLVRDNGVGPWCSPTAAPPRMALALAQSLGGDLRIMGDGGFTAQARFPE
jgi:two-component sensor histidine kinase